MPNAAGASRHTVDLPDDGSWDLEIPTTPETPYPGESGERGPCNNDDIAAACIALFGELRTQGKENYIGTTELARNLGVASRTIVAVISRLGLAPNVGRIVTKNGQANGYRLTKAQALLVTRALAGENGTGGE